MRKMLLAFSLFAIAVFALRFLYSNTPAINNEQPVAGEAMAAALQPVVQPTQPIVQPTQPIPPTQGVLPTQEILPTQVIAPTIANVITVEVPAQIEGLASYLIPKDNLETFVVNVEPESVSFHPVLKQIVQVLDYGDDAEITGEILDGDTESIDDIPLIAGLGPPATIGQTTWLTGFDWLDHSTHFASDIASTDMIVGSPTRGKVYAILWEEEAYKYGSSGWNVIVIAKTPSGRGMDGWLLFGSGHMKEEIPVRVGQIVEAGDPLGYVGMTGDPKWGITGPHMHYYVIWLKTDGTIEFLDPKNWNAIGTR